MTTRQLTWKNAEGGTSTFAAYKRSIDCGNGHQVVLVYEGKIVHQALHANQGYYTGDGNPELIGQTTQAIRGWGFARIRGEENLHQLFVEWAQSDEGGQ
jgi:hypothetical protein